QLAGKAQPFQQPSRYFSAHVFMAVKMNLAGMRITRRGRRLANVVQQGSPDQRWRRFQWQMFQNPNQMVKDRTFGVKLRRLLEYHGGRNLRQDWEQQAAFPQQVQSARRVRRTVQFEQVV